MVRAGGWCCQDPPSPHKGLSQYRCWGSTLRAWICIFTFCISWKYHKLYKLWQCSSTDGHTLQAVPVTAAPVINWVNTTVLCKAVFLLNEKGARTALRVTKKIEMELDSSFVWTGRKHKIALGNDCMRTEDSGLIAAQTLVPAKKSQATSEAPDCCQGFSALGLFCLFFLRDFKESARALATVWMVS